MPMLFPWHRCRRLLAQQTISLFVDREDAACVAVIFNKSDMKNPYRMCEIFYSTTLGTTKNSPAVSGAFFKT